MNNNRQTPPAVAQAIVAALPFDRPARFIVDIGCGPSGIWGRAIKDKFGSNSCLMLGVDIHPFALPDGYNAMVDSSFFDLWPSNQPNLLASDDFPDFLVSNPPYRDNNNRPIVGKFLTKALCMAQSVKGRVLFFVNAGFLEGKDRRVNLWQLTPPNMVIQLDGGLMDVSDKSGRVGGDKRGKIGIFWDFSNPVKFGMTRLTWVGVDDLKGYKL